MSSVSTTNIADIEQILLIELLVEELTILRTKIGLSQSEVSEKIGVLRQTYSAIETKKENVMECLSCIDSAIHVEIKKLEKC